MTSYIRKDIEGSEWCSARYMANKIGLPEWACQRFLDGPELSKECGLPMIPKQAIIFSNTLLTKEAEEVKS